MGGGALVTFRITASPIDPFDRYRFPAAQGPAFWHVRRELAAGRPLIGSVHRSAG